VKIAEQFSRLGEKDVFQLLVAVKVIQIPTARGG
jgi:hypothetical protein